MTSGEPKERVEGLVSVIVPAYQAEQSLARCIEHVLAQTYQPIELIIVNDGSTDGTEAVSLRYGDRIQYIAQENRGKTAARNRGFEQARGEFITFIDHDDYWEPRFVETTVRFLNAHREAIAVSVGFDVQTALKPGVSVHPTFLSGRRNEPEAPILLDRFFDFWADHDHICVGAAMLRGTLIDEAGGQRPDLILSGDMEYWAYLATFGKWGFIPHVLLHVDGTQVPRGDLYRKFHERFSRCATVEQWASRVIPLLREADTDGFARVRGRVATGYTFAHVFAGRDAEAKHCATAYVRDLEGKFGRLWRLGLVAGWLSWKPLCMLMRVRTRAQYYLAGRRL